MKLPEEKKSKSFKLPRILTRDGMREFRKTEEFKALKYYFAPNMDDKKYILYNFMLLLLFFVLMVVFSK